MNEKIMPITGLAGVLLIMAGLILVIRAEKRAF